MKKPKIKKPEFSKLGEKDFWKRLPKTLWDKKWKILLLTIVLVGVGAAIYFPIYWFYVLPNRGLDLEKPVNELETDLYGNKSYYPKPSRPTHLYSINASDCEGEELVTMMTLQGVLAKETPQVYISDGKYNTWLNLIKEEGINVTDRDDPWTLLGDLSDGIEGYIIYRAEGGNSPNNAITSGDTLKYEHNDESYCVAVSLCGILNACAVEESDVSKAEDAGLPELYDARGKDVEWLFESDYWDQLRHDMIFEVEYHSSRRYNLIDYPVFCGAPVWHAENQNQRSDLLKYFEADSPSFGWGAVHGDEGSLNMQITLAGGFFMPSDWSRDLSVLSAIQVDCKQKERPEITYEEDVHYVSFLMSDGDNLQWLMGDYDSDKWFGNEHRGDFPMGWMIPPAAAELCPLVLQYYYDLADPTDRFVAGNSGHGLIYPKSHHWSEIHANRSNEIFKTADVEVAVIQDWGWQPESFEDTTALPQVTGCIYNDYRQYALQSGKAMWVDDKPCVSFTYNLWLGMDSPSIIRNGIRSASINVKDNNAYSLVVVHAWSYTMDEVADLIGGFNDDVRVVDPETFVHLYSTNLDHENSFALRFRIYQGVWVVFGLIGLVVSIVIYKKRKAKKDLEAQSDSLESENEKLDVQSKKKRKRC